MIKKIFLISAFLVMSLWGFSQRLSELPAATQLLGDEITVIVQEGVTKKTEMSLIYTYVTDSILVDSTFNTAYWNALINDSTAVSNLWNIIINDSTYMSNMWNVLILDSIFVSNLWQTFITDTTLVQNFWTILTGDTTINVGSIGMWDRVGDHLVPGDGVDSVHSAVVRTGYIASVPNGPPVIYDTTVNVFLEADCMPTILLDVLAEVWIVNSGADTLVSVGDSIVAYIDYEGYVGPDIFNHGYVDSVSITYPEGDTLTKVYFTPEGVVVVEDLFNTLMYVAATTYDVDTTNTASGVTVGDEFTVTGEIYAPGINTNFVAQPDYVVGWDDVTGEFSPINTDSVGAAQLWYEQVPGTPTIVTNNNVVVDSSFRAVYDSAYITNKDLLGWISPLSTFMGIVDTGGITSYFRAWRNPNGDDWYSTMNSEGNFGGTKIQLNYQNRSPWVGTLITAFDVDDASYYWQSPRVIEVTADTTIVNGSAFFPDTLTVDGIFKLKPVASAPGTPSEGMTYADTDHNLYYYDGSNWDTLNVAGGGAGADNLGNHTATQDLDLDGNSIINASEVTVDDTLHAQHQVFSVPASDSSWFGDVVYLTLGSVTFGQVIHFSTVSDTPGKARANASATMPGVGMVLASGSGLTPVLLNGWVRKDSWNWGYGLPLYVSPTTAGLVTTTKPTGVGEYVQVLGMTYNPDVIYFYPQLFVTVVVP